MKIIKPKKSFKQRHKRSRARNLKTWLVATNKCSLNPFKDYYVFDDDAQEYLSYLGFGVIKGGKLSFGAFKYGKKTLFSSKLVSDFIFNQGKYGRFRPIKAKSKS
jgi:hypothetical protein